MCGVAFTDRLLKGELMWGKNLEEIRRVDFAQQLDRCDLRAHTSLPPACYSHTLNLHSVPSAGIPTSFPELCFSLSAFQQLPRQYCCGASAILVLSCQFCLEKFHLFHQCMCPQPVLTPIQHNGHYTSIRYQPRRERTKVPLESTYAAIVKKGSPHFLDVLIN